MKRLWSAVALMVLLFAASLYNTVQIDRITSGITSQLNQAGEAVSQGDWDTAQELTSAAMEEWDGMERYFSIVLCHGDTDEVSTGFQEVLGFLQYRSAPEYDSANSTLVAKVEHLAEMEALNWNNLL